MKWVSPFVTQLSNEEKVAVAQHVVQRADGRVPIVAGGTTLYIYIYIYIYIYTSKSKILRILKRGI